MPEPVCRCGATETLPSDATRCCNGHPLPGFPGPALKHGVRAFEQRGEASLPTELRQSVTDFVAQVRADRGGDLSAVEAAYVRRLGELEAVLRLLGSDIASKGLFTPRGRVRGTYAKWLEGLDRWDKLAQRIGLDRKARRVPTVREYLAGRQRTESEGDGT